jgi:hypothetical protein
MGMHLQKELQPQGFILIVLDNPEETLLYTSHKLLMSFAFLSFLPPHFSLAPKSFEGGTSLVPTPTALSEKTWFPY